MQIANQSRTLEISGMTGDECVKKVTNALKEVQGVTTQSVKVGSAAITCDDAACQAACQAIKAAGYTAKEASTSKDGAKGQPATGVANQAPMPRPSQSIDAAASGKPGSCDMPKAATPATAKPVTAAM